jgi:hypothetical protein
MAVNTRSSTVLANARLDNANALFNSGKILIYDGAQPATPETTLSGQNLLVTLTFNTSAFAGAVDKVATANSITSGTAVFTGTASWCRITKSDDTVLMDGSVGTATSNIVLNSVAIGIGALVSCSAFTLTLPMQGA